MPQATHFPTAAAILGTGFGIGYWPWGPGTAGSLLAVGIWLAITQVAPDAWLPAATLALAACFTLIGWWAADKLVPFWGDDPHRVVIDEMVGTWIPLLIVPPIHWGYLALAFALFRFFDILKPLGIRSLDRCKGGFWVMADDILAGIYSLLVLLAVQWVTA